jgi:hypothetical protein
VSFAAFLTAPVRDEVVILELTPRLVLSGFSRTLSAADYLLSLLPVGYWRLGADSGAGAGAVLDASGNGHHGTAAGGVTFGQAGALADGDTAIAVDGVDGVVSVAGPPAGLQIAGALTLACWFQQQTQTVLSDSGLCGTGIGAYQLVVHDPDGLGLRRLYFYLEGGGNALFHDMAFDTAWHQFAATWDGTTNANGMKLYVDGALVAERTSTQAAIAGWADFQIGHASSFFNGTLDDVAVFDRALTPAEIATLYDLRTSEATQGTAAYELTVPRLVTAGGVTVYRRVVGARENATDLTARASLAAVDANASSWFWDEATETLYVHTSTGSDPDTFTAYQARVRFYFGTKPVVLDRTDGDPDTGIYHHPWMVGSNIPDLVEHDNDDAFGAKITAGGDIELLNGHGWWHTIIAHDGEYRWKNASAALALGGAYGDTVLLRSEYAPLMAMEVEDVAADEEVCTFALKPLIGRLTEAIPKTPYFASAYPNLGDGVEGTKKWIGYGRTTMRPDLTDTSSHGVYTVADAAFQTLFAVTSATAIDKATGERTGLTLTTDYTVNLTACTVTVVNATYRWQDVDLELDVTGKPDGAGGYLHTFADVVQDILTTFLGVRASELDAASFTAAASGAPEEVAVWLKSPRTVASILATSEAGLPALEQSVRGLLSQSAAGLWRIDVWDPSYDPTTLITLRKSEFRTFRPQPALESVFGRVQVYYGFNASTGAWSVVEASDSQVQYLSDTDDVLTVFSFLRDAGDATVLAQRWLAVAGGLTLDIEFEEVGTRLAAYQVRERVLIDYDPAPVVAGALVGSPFELVEIRRSFDPTLKVSGRFGNLRGIGQFIGNWRDPAAPTYAAATLAERAVSGFWSDPSGLADPPDAASANVSRWW